MSRNLKNYQNLIKSYHILGPKARKAIEKNVDPDLLKLLCEICYNIQNKRVVVSRKQRQRLSSFKILLKNLANRSIGKRTKINQIGQKGRGFFIPLLFSVIAPLISSLIK